MDAKHYYESHITIEPVFEEQKLKFIKAFASTHKFKLADLLMKKDRAETEERSSKDTFMTSHSKKPERYHRQDPVGRDRATC